MCFSFKEKRFNSNESPRKHLESELIHFNYFWDIFLSHYTYSNDLLFQFLDEEVEDKYKLFIYLLAAIGLSEESL